MKDTAYAFGVGKIRAIENSLLTKADMEQLIAVKHVSEALKMIADKGYTSGAATRSLKKIFGDETKKLWELIEEAAPEPDIFKIFLYKNDYHNLKVIIKGLSSGKEFEEMLSFPVTVEPETIKEAVCEEKFEILPEIMAGAARKAYELLNREDDSRSACMVIDKASNDALYAGALATKNKFFEEVVRLTVDITNVKIAWRCARVGIETHVIENALSDVGSIDVKTLALLAGRNMQEFKEYVLTTYLAEGAALAEKDFSMFEKWCDNLIIKKISSAKYKAFGPEPILAYYFAKETEMKTLHIILAGKMSGLDENVIRQRVRELYV